MRYLVDIDDHLLFSDAAKCPKCNRYDYKLKYWNKEEIEATKRIHNSEGNYVDLWTGRKEDIRDLTVKQLKAAGLEQGRDYNMLIMGKQVGVYVDAAALTTLQGVESE